MEAGGALSPREVQGSFQVAKLWEANAPVSALREAAPPNCSRHQTETGNRSCQSKAFPKMELDYVNSVFFSGQTLPQMEGWEKGKKQS